VPPRGWWAASPGLWPGPLPVGPWAVWRTYRLTSVGRLPGRVGGRTLAEALFFLSRRNRPGRLSPCIFAPTLRPKAAITSASLAESITLPNAMRTYRGRLRIPPQVHREVMACGPGTRFGWRQPIAEAIGPAVRPSCFVKAKEVRRW